MRDKSMEKHLITESTINGAAIDIQTTDELLNKGSVSTYLGMYSLQADLFPTLPLFGPGGQFLNVRRKDEANNKEFELIRKEVTPFESTPEKTGITREAIEDLIQMHGKQNASKVLNALFEGIVNDEVNATVLNFVDDNSFKVDDIHISNSELYVQKIMRKVARIINKANEGIYRGRKQYCLLPYRFQSQFEVSGLFGKGELEDFDSNIIVETKKIRFVHNPDPDQEMVYVGLYNENEPNRSQAQFSPYKSDIRQAVSYETGQTNYHIFNRYALTMNPIQDKTDRRNSLMWKFKITTDD